MASARRWCCTQWCLARVVEWSSERLTFHSFNPCTDSHNLAQTLGWAGIVRVDGTAYIYLGEPGVAGVSLTPATQKSMTVRMLGSPRPRVDD